MASKRRPAVVRRLSLDLGLLVAALCLVFFGIYSLRDSQARKTIADAYVNRSVDRALKEYHETFEAPIISDLNRIREWGNGKPLLCSVSSGNIMTTRNYGIVTG